MNGTTHIWLGTLETLHRTEYYRLWRTLSTEEHGRAQRYLRDTDRERFVHTHGLVREILAQYVDTTPEELEFEYGPHGKPAVAQIHESAVEFSVSHCGRYVAIAVSDVRIGIDVEEVVPVDFESVMELSFSQSERDAVKQLGPLQSPRLFYNAWTRKEAYLKAIGSGFTIAADRVEVSVLPWEPPALIESPAGGDVFNYTLLDLPLISGYSGAVAVATRSPQVRYWKLRSGDSRRIMELGGSSRPALRTR